MLESFFYTVGSGDDEMLNRVAQSWSHIRCKGKLHFGKRDCVAYSSYLSWIDDRVEAVGLPFPKVESLYPQEPENPDFVPKGDFDKVASMNKNLRQEREEMSLQV